MNKNLLSIKEYKTLFQNNTINDFFNDMAERRIKQPGNVEVGMIRFFNGEYVPGGPWNGNYGMYFITDFTRYKSVKGRKRVEIEGGYDYVDSSDMFDLVPYNLLSTEENIKAEVERKRKLLYNIPHRFFDIYRDKLTIMIGSQKCQGSNLTDRMLEEILLNMTSREKSKYQQSLYNIDVSLYPSLELPVRIRIDGRDDGAEEALFESVDSAKKVMVELSGFHTRDHRERFGFKGTN